MVNIEIIRIWTYLKVDRRIHGIQHNLQNIHHQLTVVIGSQRGKTCWPYRFKLISNINAMLNKAMNTNNYYISADVHVMKSFNDIWYVR